MNDSFNRLKMAIKRYMQGIYGFDQLGGALLIATAVFLALGARDNLVMSLFALAAVGWGSFRALSQNHEARAAENEQFMMLLQKPKAWIARLRNRWENRDTKAYVRCPNCHKQFALPKGKGKLRATCPHCGEKSIHKV